MFQIVIKPKMFFNIIIFNKNYEINNWFNYIQNILIIREYILNILQIYQLCIINNYKKFINRVNSIYK